jgi:hypothetical protein
VKLWYAEEEQCLLTEHRALRKAQPNKPLKLTPLCGRKIGAILTVGIGPSVFPIYWCGAA